MAPPRNKYGIDSFVFNVFAWFGLGVALPLGVMISFPFAMPRGKDAPLSRYIDDLIGLSQFAASWMFPFIIMWSEEAARITIVNSANYKKGLYYGSLFLTTVFFGLNLVIPTSVSSPGHTAVAFLFSIFAAVHFIVIMSLDHLHIFETILLATGCPIFLLTAIAGILPASTWPNHFFFVVEVISLTFLLLYTPLHVFLKQPRKETHGLSDKRLGELLILFKMYDLDKNGNISFVEVKKAFKASGIDFDDEKVIRSEFGSMDRNGDDFVTLSEFIEYQKAALLEHGPLIPIGNKSAALADSKL
mmetsp:Transcript_1163/g.1623  ORF Transcript_1163/g.1623 Transcript_1163/m.1623 type:complete len:302 (+) Transcript_1163:74-979(+)